MIIEVNGIHVEVTQLPKFIPGKYYGAWEDSYPDEYIEAEWQLIDDDIELSAEEIKAIEDYINEEL